MITSRNQLYQALFAQTLTLPNIALRSRRMPTMDVLKASLTTGQTAIIQQQVSENVVTEQHFALPPHYLVRVDWLLIAPTPMELMSEIPSVPLNDLVDAIETLFPSYVDGATGINNLGIDSVERCMVSGEIYYHESLTDNMSWVLIPLLISCV